MHKFWYTLPGIVSVLLIRAFNCDEPLFRCLKTQSIFQCLKRFDLYSHHLVQTLVKLDLVRSILFSAERFVLFVLDAVNWLVNEEQTCHILLRETQPFWHPDPAFYRSYKRVLDIDCVRNGTGPVTRLCQYFFELFTQVLWLKGGNSNCMHARCRWYFSDNHIHVYIFCKDKE